MSDEIWKDVPGYDFLMASSFGRLMVKAYIAEMPHGGQRMYGGQPTKGQWAGTRYIYICKGKTKTLKVARLVCAAFNGPAPQGKNVCMHLDEDARNNRPENLKWGTQKENLNAPGFRAYCKRRRGANSPSAKGMAKNKEAL